jgi:hypothetical protein
MKIVMLYHPASDHGRTVEEYVHDFTKLNPEVNLEAMSVDTRAGAQMAALYSVMAYPTMLALRESGELVKTWEGLPLPLMNDVAYFTFT